MSCAVNRGLPPIIDKTLGKQQGSPYRHCRPERREGHIVMLDRIPMSQSIAESLDDLSEIRLAVFLQPR